MDTKQGFSISDTLLVTADIMILKETVSFTREADMASGAIMPSTSAEILSGKFVWKVHNFSLFREMIKTQKIMSPLFTAGECSLRLSVYQSTVQAVDYLSVCLESKDTDKAGPTERTCWCLFRLSVNSRPVQLRETADSGSFSNGRNDLEGPICFLGHDWQMNAQLRN